MVINTWSLNRRWQRLQRPLAVALITVGAFLLWARGNAPPATELTVVAAADVPAGKTVQRSDVHVVDWPVAHRPPAAARSTDEIVGRAATAAIFTGEPLTSARVAGPGALSAAGAELVAVMLPEDPMAKSGLIRAGDRVNVVGQSDTGPRTLVAASTVLSVTDDSGVIVAVPASSAGAVVEAAATGSAAVVLLSGEP